MYICVGVHVYIYNGCLPFLLLLVILRIKQIYFTPKKKGIVPYYKRLNIS